jgi:hypothetical protein
MDEKTQRVEKKEKMAIFEIILKLLKLEYLSKKSLTL